MNEFILIKQILGAFLLGALIGFEREFHGSSAGIRTYSAIALGACLFGILSTHVAAAAAFKSIVGAVEFKSEVDPSRIAAQIVSGVGFIGGGVIFKSGAVTKGLATAATIWVTAAIGLAVAFDMVLVPIAATLMVIMILSLSHFKFWIDFRKRRAVKFDNETEK